MSRPHAYPMISWYISFGVQLQFSKFATVRPAINTMRMTITFMTVKILLTEVNSFTPNAIRTEKCSKGTHHEIFFNLTSLLLQYKVTTNCSLVHETALAKCLWNNIHVLLKSFLINRCKMVSSRIFLKLPKSLLYTKRDDTADFDNYRPISLSFIIIIIIIIILLGLGFSWLKVDGLVSFKLFLMFCD